MGHRQNTNQYASEYLSQRWMNGKHEVWLLYTTCHPLLWWLNGNRCRMITEDWLGRMIGNGFCLGGRIILAQEYRNMHDDVIKWKHFPRYWPFVRGTHRSPVNSPHKGQWRGALMCPLICVGINGWINNREFGDLRRYCVHYDVSVMDTGYMYIWLWSGLW